MSILAAIDIRSSFRFLTRTPLTAILAGLSLALALAASAIGLSLAVALLRVSPIYDPGAVVKVIRQIPSSRGALTESDFLFWSDFEALSTSTAALSGVTAEIVTSSTLGDYQPTISFGGMGAPLRVAAVSTNYFGVLGIRVIGRTFHSADNTIGAPPVVILSEKVWRTTFGSSGSLVGQSVAASSGQTIQVIGIAMDGFEGVHLGEGTEAWIPINTVPQFALVPPRFLRSGLVRVIGRLQPGLSAEFASKEIASVVPGAAVRSISSARYSSRFASTAARDRWVVGFSVVSSVAILLIGLSNSAALLLARARARGSELRIRDALGSTRLSLFALLGIEAVTCVALGSLLAYGLGAIAIWALSSQPLPSGLEVAQLKLDVGDTLVWLSALAACTCVLASVVIPVRRIVNRTIAKDVEGPRLRRYVGSGGLIVGYTAVSITLVIAATLAGKSLRLGLDADPGFSIQDTLTIEIQPSIFAYGTRYSAAVDLSQVRATHYARLLGQLQMEPGVEAVAIGSLPLDTEPTSSAVTLDPKSNGASVVACTCWCWLLFGASHSNQAWQRVREGRCDRRGGACDGRE